METSQFTELCKNEGLSLNEDTYTEALNLLKKIKQDVALDQIDKHWFGFVLYSVTRLSQSTNHKALTLCEILKATKLTMPDFFKEMPAFVRKAGPVMRNVYGEDWEKRLEAKDLLNANSGGMNFLRNSYDRVYNEFFRNDEECCRFGWLLFLVLGRSHAFSTSGLVSVLCVLILHVPVKFRRFCIGGDSTRFVRNERGSVEVVKSLCKIYDVLEDDLRRTTEKVNDVVITILKKKPSLGLEFCKAGNLEGIEMEGLTYFEGLMEGQSLLSSLGILENYDGEENLSEGAKRKFDEIKIASHSLEENVSCSIPAPSSPALSPEKRVRLGDNLTPISPSIPMTAAEWLRAVISPLPSKPSAELEHILSSFDRNIIGKIACRAHMILEAVFPRSALQSANLMESIWAEQRRREALKLYYKVLEAICTAESQVGNANKLSSLLSNESFHRCMLACSAELVLATDKTVSILFPVVLERTGLTAFDLSKVIESFVRYEVSLPRELRRHLNSLEERLLESMVWQKGSSMYNSLVVANPALSAEVTRLGLLAEPMPSLSTVAVHYNIPSRSLPHLFSQHEHGRAVESGHVQSPKRNFGESQSVLEERNSFAPAFSSLRSKLLSPPLQYASASQRSPNPGGSKICAEKGISLLFSKILKLAAIRINGMVERLKLDQHIRETVYSLMQQILSRVTTLFFNRHIDQIILCCLYSVAKIFQMKLTFEEIVCNYKKQPQAKPQVYRSIFVDWSSTRHNGRTGLEHVGIVQFYNQVFLPSVQPLLKEVSGASANLNPNLLPEGDVNGQGSGSPRVSSFPHLPDMSPKKVSAAHNVYVSPLQSSKMDSLISYSSKSFYAFLGQSTQAYRIPSKDLSDINNLLNGKKANMNLDFEDGSLISDSSSCLAGLFPPLKSEQPDSH